ncbi:MAG TPA: glycosyltransferase family 39 protein [Kofleriaceae bacterium]
MARARRVVVAAGVFALAQIAIVLGGYADNGALCDDAFYYFQIAKHAAHGASFSFDGIYATNGFHPLLAWLEVPVFAIFDSPWLPVHVVLCLLGLSTAATAYVLFRIGRTLGNERMGELAALFFLLSPFAWIIPLRGCEGGLSVLCIALVIWQGARMRHLDLRGTLVLGGLVGLAGLARTENVLLGAAMFAWLVARTRNPRVLLAFAASAAVTVSPWAVWNLVRFGTIVQVSGAAKVAFHLFHPLYKHRLYEMFAHAEQFVIGEEFMTRERTIVAVLVTCVLITTAIVIGGKRRPPTALFPVAILVVLHVLFYGYVQRSYFNWYVMPVVLGAALLQAERIAQARRGVVVALLTAAAAQCVITLALFAAHYPRWPHASEQRIAGQLALVDRLPADANIAGWNVGALGYFSTLRRPDITFFNLDCVVNNPLFAAWKRGAYTTWIRDHVDWLVEEPHGEIDLAALARDGELWRVRR